MATLQLEAGDVVEALNVADHDYLAELFNQWIEGKSTSDETHRKIGLHILARLCSEHDAMELREYQSRERYTVPAHERSQHSVIVKEVA